MAASGITTIPLRDYVELLLSLEKIKETVVRELRI